MAVTEQATTCFVDTNIWLYAFIEAEAGHKQARAKAVIQDNEVIVSTQVINEVCVNLLKKTRFTEPDIQALILFTVITESWNSIRTVCSKPPPYANSILSPIGTA